MKTLVKGKLGLRGGVSELKSKAERLAKWLELKEKPWHKDVVEVGGDQARAATLPWAAELEALGIVPLPLQALAPPPPPATPAPTVANAGLSLSVGASVDAMTSMSDLDAFIEIAKNRKAEILAGSLI